jgi:predicted nucleic acid-binding protein
MYLVDTNIWLERLLAQAKSDEAGAFLDHAPSSDFYITDFSFHSICVILARLNKPDVLLEFVRDIFIDGAVNLVSVRPEETTNVIDRMGIFRLDFDDAYQYAAAEKYNLTIVSFDTDFNRTGRGRKTPAEILAAT